MKKEMLFRIQEAIYDEMSNIVDTRYIGSYKTKDYLQYCKLLSWCKENDMPITVRIEKNGIGFEERYIESIDVNMPRYNDDLASIDVVVTSGV